MNQFIKKSKDQNIYRERDYRIEPMLGIEKDIYDLKRCLIRGKQNKRWLFIGIRLTIQMPKLDVLKKVDQLRIFKNKF